MRKLLGALGTAVACLVHWPLMLVLLVLVLPGIAVHRGIDEIVSRVRREPRVSPADTGIVLAGGPDAGTSRGIVTDAILVRCSGRVIRREGGGGDVVLSSEAMTDLPVVIREAEAPYEEDGTELEVDIGPWTMGCPEGVDYGEGDAAVAMDAAYLDHGLTCRVIRKRTVALLRLEEPGVWWRPPADGEEVFSQSYFRELPGRPATDTERARHLERTAVGSAQD